MTEAYAQTAEVIDAGSKAYGTYAESVGPVAATWALVCVLLMVAIYLLFRRLEQRDLEITELKVKCAREIEQAKLDAEKEAEARVALAWQRVGEIFGSVNILFGKVDGSNAKVAETLSNLQITLANRGVTVK